MNSRLIRVLKHFNQLAHSLQYAGYEAKLIKTYFGLLFITYKIAQQFGSGEGDENHGRCIQRGGKFLKK